MSPTTIQPAGQLVAGVRTAVDDHADWSTTAQLVADYGTDVTRVGSSVRRYYDLPAER